MSSPLQAIEHARGRGAFEHNPIDLLHELEGQSLTLDERGHLPRRSHSLDGHPPFVQVLQRVGWDTPSPSSSPNSRLRPPIMVTSTSPVPARPETVSSLPPRATTNSRSSAQAWVNRAAFALRYSNPTPFPSPSRIPRPIAATFLATMEYSTPGKSSEVVTWYVVVRNTSAAASADSR